MKRSVTMGRDKLTDYGINLLTGEACSHNLRMLCDLSEKGVEIVSSWLGILPSSFLPNWNSYVGNDPAVASIMIPRGSFPDLYYWILVEVEKFEVVMESADGMLTGVNLDNPYYKTYMENREMLSQIYPRVSRFPKNENSVSGRNVHQFSGRIA